MKLFPFDTPPSNFQVSFLICRVFCSLGIFLIYVMRGFLSIFFSFKCSLNAANHEIYKAERTKTSRSGQRLLILLHFHLWGILN